MRQLSTPVEFSPGFNFQSMPRRIASIGSCFSEKVIELLASGDFECSSNPNGIVYNPFSIAESVRHITERIPYGESDLFRHDGKIHSREHHGTFSSGSIEETLLKAETERKAFEAFLEQPCPVILTFGTAVVFREKETGRIVANCHKVPGTAFSRDLLSVPECAKNITDSVRMLLRSGDHPVILAVSPVRHHPGDPVLNSRSKAVLIETCHEAEEAFPEKCIYFPAYEYLHDELRDYRFYAEDLVHPSSFAEEFILERFIRKFYPESAERILSLAWNRIKQKKHIPGEK